jgi:hypothetical protein
MKNGRMKNGARWVVLFAVAAACGGVPPGPTPAPMATSIEPAATPAEEPTPVPIATLRTGTTKARLLAPVEGKLLERGVVAGAEIFRVELPSTFLEGLLREGATGEMRVSVSGEVGPVGFLTFATAIGEGAGAPPHPPELWFRRQSGAAGPLEVQLLTDEVDGGGAIVPITLDASANTPTKPGIDRRWALALASDLDRRYDLPFAPFAAARLRGKKAGVAANPTEMADWVDWTTLMELTTGTSSVRAALQEGTRLRSEVDRFRPNLPITTLAAPRLQRHPWPQMLQALNRPVPPEPLAEAAPADFYYARADDVAVLFQLLDEIDVWGTPLARLVEGRSDQHHLSERYRTALGLPGGELTRLIGPKVVRRLALVGSDPFLRQGSDVTLIVEAADEGLFRAGVKRDLALALEGRGTPGRREIDHRGVTIAVVHSSDGAVRQHRASIGGFELVSNSENAIRRVIDTIQGKQPALSNEPDFQYMLARDAAVAHQVLVYAGDRFVEHAAGPRSRILDARRQVAVAELMRPAFAALTYGWLTGEAPAELEALRLMKLLDDGDLRHFDGSSIAFNPGSAPRSLWGTPQSLTPLIDLPDVKTITQVEQEAYREFVRRYESIWSEALDPIALRVRLEEVGGQRRLVGKLRVLPLMRDGSYDDIREVVGKKRLRPGRSRDGIRLLLAIAPDSALRRELTETSRGFLGKELKLDWVGDYAVVGLLDRPELANAVHRAGLAPEPPGRTGGHDETAALFQLPLYAAVAVKSRASAALVFTLLKAKLASFGFRIEKQGSHRGVTIMRIREEDGEEGQGLSYALSDHALYLSPQAWVIEQLLDEEALGGLPTAADERNQDLGQATLEIQAKTGGGLATSVHWLFEHSVSRHASIGEAEMLLVGAPAARANAKSYEALSLAYLGSIPLTPDGKPFELRPSGAADPHRGNDHERSWPALPLPGSPTSRVLEALELLRTDIGFDDEPTPPGSPEARSLAVTITIGRR